MYAPATSSPGFSPPLVVDFLWLTHYACLNSIKSGQFFCRAKAQWDVVLLPCRTKFRTIKFDKSTALESNFWIKFSKAIKFDKLCRATRLWHVSDSNVAPLPCHRKSIPFARWFCDDFMQIPQMPDLLKTLVFPPNAYSNIPSFYHKL